MKSKYYQFISNRYILKIIFTFIISIFTVLIIYSQDCTGYHQYHCPYGDFSFFYSRQSKSALFEKGQKSELRITVYGGEDYYIAVCAHRKFGDLRFRLIEDNSAGTVIYDNADDDYSESIIFSNESTRNLIIEVSVPEGADGEKSERRCVGVVIQFRKTGETDGSGKGLTGF